MSNLITTAQAQALLPGLSAAEVAALAGLGPAASSAVERYCRRKLSYGSYVEYHRPANTRKIRLRAWPVSPGSLDLRTSPEQVATLTCSDTAAQRASASLTSTGLTLARSRSGAPPASVLALASSVTLADLQAAVAGAGGWSMAIAPGYAAWLVADLEPNPGAMSGLGQSVGLTAYVRGLSLYAIDDPSTGVIELTEDRPQEFRFADRAFGGVYGFGSVSGGFGDPRRANVRCAYSAGFDASAIAGPPVPDDLQLAVALTIRASIDSGQFSGIITKADLGNTSFEIGQQMVIPSGALPLLGPYRNRRF
jgi:hypothetical protein